MITVAYPRLIKRVRAALIDSVLVPIAVFGTLLLGNALGVTHPLGMAMLILVPIFVLEPGLVAFTGGTVGHHLLKIRVTRIDGTGNINVFAATVRFVLKVLLGWLSFILILTTAKHQAVHDLAARSRVIYKDPTGLPTYEVLAERALDSAAYVYPSAWRRVAIIIAYGILATVTLVIATLLVASMNCIEMGKCTTLAKLFEIVLSVAWIVSIGWIIVLGWNGRLYGCRKRQREPGA